MDEQNNLLPDLVDKNTTRLPQGEQVKLGQWYWVTETCRWDGDNGGKEGDTYTWLGCIMKIGSNFVELHPPHSDRGGHGCTRVHFNEFNDVLKREENPESVIKENIQHCKAESNRLLNEVRSLTLRLGLNPKHYLTSTEESDECSNALVAISNKDNINTYKRDLIEAKEKTLPDLFKAIKSANENLCQWMMAETMETQALMIPMEKSIKEIDNRIFTVSLYAGLVEEVKEISDGESAGITDKLHIMQRKLYMDEECLLNYSSGGMTFADINEFDEWIAKPENRNRILPFPRTLVAMQVRRKVKDRDWEGDPLQIFINIQIKQSDKFTFLYIRNGEQLYRLSCEIEFGRMIFPDKNIYDPSTAKMVKMFAGHVDKMIPLSEYEVLLKEYEDCIAKSEQWERDNPTKDSFMHNPYRYSSFNPSDWKPFDQTNLYYDECIETISSEVREYNRIALIVQGLFDRSLVLHPHLPVKTWIAESFNSSIKLVYDGDMTINYGNPPDFEAYRSKCNESLCVDSVTTGQQQFWLEHEAEKENNRLDHNWRNKSTYRHKIFAPYGNPGPGRITKIAVWKKRSKQAIFRWEREKAWNRYDYSGKDTTTATITVPASKLLNVSAYHSGDYLQFFNDPRTREQYLKWAPLLLAAEDYVNKKGE